ncbi:prepilin peptidase [Ruicaihuangia caeni]|uniref:Prepilin leader peptidase/N-methyltransferase n=1 Tax=Ruicaihuangia caeni TaxID=3042517 RepID=A0AAW6TBX9_9MICO|nr:A24 family peptidase [Klugiella sp. YN-L-19]MDI2098552.1 prepilin peptidase [Klugiella sp. YN-L-19]
MVATLSAVFGLLIGSFLNVVVHRVPARRSIVSPPSACTNCGSRIRAIDNVPVVSWIALRGRCRHCAAPISMRYPLVEAGTALAFGLVAWWSLAQTTEAPAASRYIELGAYLYLAAVSIALALIDLDTRTLPNRIVLPSYLVAGAALSAAALIAGTPEVLVRAAIGAGILFAAYLLLALIVPRGMGMGDVKLAGVLGLYLAYQGWGQLTVGAFAAFVLGGVFGVALLLARKAKRGSGIPFGPWMIAGAWLGLVVGEPIAGGYLALIGL